MTLNEYKELEIGEIIGNVRCSNVAQGCSIFQLQVKQGLIGHILNLLKYDGSVDNYEDFLIAYKFLHKFCNLNGNGTIESPYIINTEFASGGFVDICHFMKNKQLPHYIENNACHKNCYLFAGLTKTATAITGIYKLNKDSHLHSIVETNGVVLDFNWGIAMSKNLYVQLFNFEELNRVQGEKLAEDYEFINKNIKKLNYQITYAELLACYDEVLNDLKTETNKLSL